MWRKDPVAAAGFGRRLPAVTGPESSKSTNRAYQNHWRPSAPPGHGGRASVNSPANRLFTGAGIVGGQALADNTSPLAPSGSHGNSHNFSAGSRPGRYELPPCRAAVSFGEGSPPPGSGPSRPRRGRCPEGVGPGVMGGPGFRRGGKGSHGNWCSCVRIFRRAETRRRASAVTASSWDLRNRCPGGSEMFLPSRFPAWPPSGSGCLRESGRATAVLGSRVVRPQGRNGPKQLRRGCRSGVRA
ncbi:hypothetical protein H4W79_003720 [Nocardiopsis terrae]|uniref:Uncharacterized protein n=1 Tax=Nocardiopsis terrae TaxID=372655 RepID=A0ABR9HKK4_9ACTN|nr:hypothetical protein [Nocardiopsis terrae]